MANASPARTGKGEAESEMVKEGTQRRQKQVTWAEQTRPTAERRPEPERGPQGKRQEAAAALAGRAEALGLAGSLGPRPADR
eukprot:3917352-Pleurochrysis_carterae.AAC.1